MIRALGIFSGGLDSLLSARLLMDQGLSPTLVTFVSPFFRRIRPGPGPGPWGDP